MQQVITRTRHMSYINHLKSVWIELDEQYTSEWETEMLTFLKKGVKSFYDIDPSTRAYLCSLYLAEQKIEDQDDFIAEMKNPGQLLNNLLHSANQPHEFNKLLAEVEHGIRLDCESKLSDTYYDMRTLLEDF